MCHYIWSGLGLCHTVGPPLLDVWDPLAGSSRNDLGDWAYGLHARDAAGHPLTQSQLDEVYHQFRLAGAKEGITAHLHELQLNYADYYQPAVRFWHFQTIESTAYLTLALLAFTLWCRRCGQGCWRPCGAGFGSGPRR